MVCPEGISKQIKAFGKIPKHDIFAEIRQPDKRQLRQNKTFAKIKFCCRLLVAHLTANTSRFLKISLILT